MSLGSQIASWDKKAVATIKLTYEQHHTSPDFLDEIINYCQEPELEVGASWLLKFHFEQDGDKLTPKQITHFSESLSRLNEWEAKLHLLQCLPYIVIPENQRNAVETFVRQCLNAEQKFVRAWAYNGFYLLAAQFRELKEEAQNLLHTALEQEEAASVKARIRNILKQGFA